MRYPLASSDGTIGSDAIGDKLVMGCSGKIELDRLDGT